MEIPIFNRYEYRGKQYIVRDIELQYSVCRIAPESLWRQIQAHNDEEGKQIDETIFFYVPDKLIVAGKTALEHYVQENL